MLLKKLKGECNIFLKKNIESVCGFKNSCTFAAVIKNGCSTVG